MFPWLLSTSIGLNPRVCNLGLQEPETLEYGPKRGVWDFDVGLAPDGLLRGRRLSGRMSLGRLCEGFGNFRVQGISVLSQC